MVNMRISEKMMTKKYELVLNYIKDLSVEVPDSETFIISREQISKYVMGININSKALKNKMIEVITKLEYKDPGHSKKKSYFEILYASVIKVKEENLDKKVLEKIILCDLQNEIYPKLEKIFLGVIKDAGFPDLKFEKKIDFEQLYNQRLN